MSKTPSVIKVISEVKKMNQKKQTHSSNWKGAHGCTVLSSQHNDRQRIILNLQSRDITLAMISLAVGALILFDAIR